MRVLLAPPPLLQETAKCFPETAFGKLVAKPGDESCSAAGYVNSEWRTVLVRMSPMAQTHAASRPRRATSPTPTIRALSSSRN